MRIRKIGPLNNPYLFSTSSPRHHLFSRKNSSYCGIRLEEALLVHFSHCKEVWINKDLKYIIEFFLRSIVEVFFLLVRSLGFAHVFTLLFFSHCEEVCGSNNIEKHKTILYGSFYVFLCIFFFFFHSLGLWVDSLYSCCLLPCCFLCILSCVASPGVSKFY